MQDLTNRSGSAADRLAALSGEQREAAYRMGRQYRRWSDSAVIPPETAEAIWALVEASGPVGR